MTSWSEVTLLVAAGLLLLLWLVWVSANRLDRLHRKVATSRSALENQLVRRASAAAELASSGLLDPVSSVLVGEAAWAALSAGGYGRAELVAALPDLDRMLGPDGPGARADDPVERDLGESELSRTVREALADDDEVAALVAQPGGAELVEALAAAWYRVQLARRFHNEAVAQAQRVRHKVVVRALRLAGHAPLPQTVEIDDDWPEALRRVAQAA
ncbi:hypothetical protein [Actinotalea fermentans]|uniref:Membrane protein n=1 Tax=Actinotalea fermentans TaxID=43671 RepID=A0A511YUE6_9CELL|nr:hypothetical protein [Actinotalea fermentans]KGM17299.1 hypothetical protein N867_06255 [Actinotalea fermentans ATCC 43279 = JCM 9966 = DSM 3133]GEN78814.1 membrane protein [Actinotalea fermentans]